MGVNFFMQSNKIFSPGAVCHRIIFYSSNFSNIFQPKGKGALGDRIESHSTVPILVILYNQKVKEH